MVSAVPASKNYNGSNRSSLVQAGTRAINAFGAFFPEEALGKGPPFFTKNLAAEVTRTLVALCSAEAFGQSTPEGTLTSIAGHGHRRHSRRAPGKNKLVLLPPPCLPHLHDTAKQMGRLPKVPRNADA